MLLRSALYDYYYYYYYYYYSYSYYYDYDYDCDDYYYHDLYGGGRSQLKSRCSHVDQASSIVRRRSSASLAAPSASALYSR